MCLHRKVISYLQNITIMENRQLDPQLITDKENIRKNIRNGLAAKRPAPLYGKDVTDSEPEPIDDLFVEFINRFREAGGKYIPCTTQNMVQLFVKIAQGQQYHTVLNTSSNLGKYLDKYKVRYVNAVNPNEPVDAAIFFTDVLVARNGAVGFTQAVGRYASVKNLAKDIIVVSRERCIFQDLEDALEYQRQRNGGTAYPLTEFVIPTKPEEINGKPVFSPREPRIILMLIEEPKMDPQPAEQVVEQPTQQPVEPQQNITPETNTDDEPKNQESID